MEIVMAEQLFSEKQVKAACTFLDPETGSVVGHRRTPCADDVLKQLSEFAKVLRIDGTVGGKRRAAEKLALVYSHLDERETAYRIFEAIVEGTPPEDILFLDEDKGSPYASSALSPVCGKLGYRGVFRFAELAIHFGNNERAVALLLLIAEKIPVRCNPIGLQSIRLGSLERLQGLGVDTVCNGVAIDEAIRTADRVAH